MIGAPSDCSYAGRSGTSAITGFITRLPPGRRGRWLPTPQRLEEGPIVKLCDERYVCGSKPLAFTMSSHFRIQTQANDAYTRVHKIPRFVLAHTTRLAPARLWRGRRQSASCSPGALGSNRGRWSVWGSHGARRHSSNITSVGMQRAACSEALAFNFDSPRQESSSGFSPPHRRRGLHDQVLLRLRQARGDEKLTPEYYTH